MYDAVAARGAALEEKWEAMFVKYGEKYPEEAADIKRRMAGKLPDGWEKCLPRFTPADEAVASRKLSENLLAKISVAVPEFVSGSADLTPSNLTRWKNAVDFQPASNGLGDFSGRYIRYGVREHGMGAIMNGIAAYGPNLVIPAAGASPAPLDCADSSQVLSSTSSPTPPERSDSPPSLTSVSSGSRRMTRASSPSIVSKSC